MVHMMLTIKEINELIPQVLRDKYNLTLDGLAMFLAQCDHESMGFTRLEENLNYSVNRLKVIFLKYFKYMNDKEIDSYVLNPEKLANYVYANRMGNGSIESGDGYKFRGRGYIQLTGRDNYTRCSKALGIDIVKSPDLLLLQEYSLQSSLWFFADKKIFNNLDFEYVTRKINGGTHGLAERQSLFNKYMSIL